MRFELAFFRAAFCLLLFASTGLHAEDGPPFWKGKTVTVVVGNGAGAGNDIYARLLARHIAQYLPGRPNVIVNNMPGASGLVAFNWLANVAPRDGTIIATGSASTAFEPILGDGSAKFDGASLNWIGSMETGVSVCLVRTDAGILNWSDILTKEVTFGAASRSGPPSQVGRALIQLTGAKIRLIEGYVGTADIKLALERKEVQGLCGIGLTTVRAQWQNLFDNGTIKIYSQVGKTNDPSLGDVPSTIDFAKNDRDRKIMSLIFAPQELGRSFATTPNVPADRLKDLQSAFQQTMNDKAFKEDAARQNLELAPRSGSEIQSVVESIYATSKDDVNAARAVLEQ